jgi:hypothetical protein
MAELSNGQEAVSRRIRALLSKTIENGATEAEAIAAAGKARELMDQHRLTMSDVEIQAEPIVKEEVDRPNRIKPAAVDDCLEGIDRCCGVKTWFHRRWDETGRANRRVVILGLKADVEMARYLYDTIATAIRVETRAHRWFSRDDRASFQVGMARRINFRLLQMAREREPVAKTASGTALVVVKDRLVSDAFDRLGIKFGRGLAGMQWRSLDAYAAGQLAGDKVNLGRPISAVPRHRIQSHTR